LREGLPAMNAQLLLFATLCRAAALVAPDEHASAAFLGSQKTLLFARCCRERGPPFRRELCAVSHASDPRRSEWCSPRRLAASPLGTGKLLIPLRGTDVSNAVSALLRGDKRTGAGPWISHAHSYVLGGGAVSLPVSQAFGPVPSARNASSAVVTGNPRSDSQ
jgi:hypothetical protein